MESETDARQPIPADGSIRSLLILRPDSLGDLVLFSGALRLIRQTWPNAQITLCVQAAVADYLELCPYVDSVILWEQHSGFLHSTQFKRKLRSLAPIGGKLFHVLPAWLSGMLASSRLSYDALLFPVRSPDWRHHLFVRSVSARVKVGLSGDFANQSFNEDQVAGKIYTARYFLPQNRMQNHELVVTRDLLNFLGIAADLNDLQPAVWTSRSDTSKARDFVPDTDMVKLAIVPGAGLSRKIYPLESIAAAISQVRNSRLSCFIFGSMNEVGLCAELHDRLSQCSTVHEVVDLSAKTTIRNLVESLRLCDIVLAADSAALHIATAIGKPTVGIMGGAHYGRFYPWGDPEINRVACKHMDCYGCHWKCSKGSAFCISTISPSVVARELQYLVDRIKH